MDIFSYRFCDDLVRVLGFDWILLFMQSNIHSSSIIWTYKILTTLCSVPSLLVKFREASSNGGWLLNTELLQNNKANLMLSNVPYNTYMIYIC